MLISSRWCSPFRSPCHFPPLIRFSRSGCAPLISLTTAGILITYRRSQFDCRGLRIAVMHRILILIFLNHWFCFLFLPADVMCQGFNKGPVNDDGLVSCELFHNFRFEDDPDYNCFLNGMSQFSDLTNIVFILRIQTRCFHICQLSFFFNFTVSLHVFNHFCFSPFPATIYDTVSRAKDEAKEVTDKIRAE